MTYTKSQLQFEVAYLKSQIWIMKTCEDGQDVDIILVTYTHTKPKTSLIWLMITDTNGGLRNDQKVSFLYYT